MESYKLLSHSKVLLQVTNIAESYRGWLRSTSKSGIKLSSLNWSAHNPRSFNFASAFKVAPNGGCNFPNSSTKSIPVPLQTFLCPPIQLRTVGVSQRRGWCHGNVMAPTTTLKTPHPLLRLCGGGGWVSPLPLIYSASRLSRNEGWKLMPLFFSAENHFCNITGKGATDVNHHQVGNFNTYGLINIWLWWDSIISFVESRDVIMH